MARPLVLVAAGLSLCAWNAWGYLAEASPGLVRHLAARFGAGAQQRLQDWQQAARRLPPAPREEEARLLDAANALANRLPYAADREHWQQDEYWATPAEFVGSGAGDCEDYSIAKYHLLRAAGVPAERLRLTYVKAYYDNRLANHMVLAYYATPQSEPLVLDNLHPGVLRAGARSDLVPVFSFNDEDLWNEARGGTQVDGGAGHVRRWRELRERVRLERSL